MGVTLADIKKALNITGDYQDNALTQWMDETVAYLRDAGVQDSTMTAGLIARGVADLWNYGAGNGKLSVYFMQRAAQLAYKG